MRFRSSSQMVSPPRISPSAFLCALGALLLASGIVPLDSQITCFSRSITRSFVATAKAAEPESKPQDKYDRNVSSHGKIKLNYYSASWPRVFQDLADSFEMEFVGDFLPTGRFSRNDHAEHTLKDAVRIINHEIEPQGFRLVEKGRFLILLETTLRRPQPPATAKKPANPPAEDAPERVNEHATRETIEKPHPLSTESDSRPNRSVDTRQSKSSNAVRQAAYQDSDDAPNFQQLARVVEQIEQWSSSDEPQVHLLRLKHISSKPTAELLTSVFGTMTDSFGKSTRLRSAITIVDISKANSLLITASETELASIVDLASQLDCPVDPQAEFQVFRWRAAFAMEVDTVIAEFSKQRKTIASRALIVTCPSFNAIVVRARPQDLDEIETWITRKSAQLTR